jgi:lysophospholipase L1-like esterase
VVASLVLVASACGSSSSSHSATASSDRHQAWLGAWAAAPSDAGPPFTDQTLRLNLTPLRGGDEARVHLSNRFGTAPLTFGRVFLGKQASGAALVPGSNRPVLFHGRTTVVVPIGQEAISDPVHLSFGAFEHLAVSVYLPGTTGASTRHSQAKQRSYMTATGTGDHSDDDSGSAFGQVINAGMLPLVARPFVTGIDVLAPTNDAVVVALGDSLTDGDQRSAKFAELGVDQDARYPDFLDRRLLAHPELGLSVVNEGIGGNRLLRNAFTATAGDSLLNRIPRDVLARDDVADVILVIGTNDLGQGGVTADELVAGLRRAVGELHELRGGCPGGPLVLVGTIPPTAGATEGPRYAGMGPERQQVNAAIRSGHIGDGVVDFDRVLRDPRHPDRLLPRYDSGDHLHPSSAGYARMADEVDLSALRTTRC